MVDLGVLPLDTFERDSLVGVVDEGNGERGTTRIGDCSLMMPIAVDGRAYCGLGGDRSKRS